ncbi:MAG: hypothetical protein HC880_13430 [Bacteroidia bacterium]|nr:hypothetical protein [Bacteroidia bacterium]
MYLGYRLYAGVRDPIVEQYDIAGVERKIIRKLEMIRDLQIAYQSQNDRYARSWDELINFVRSGRFTVVQQRERTKLNDRGIEEVTIEYDTLGTVPIVDSLDSKYPELDGMDLASLPVIPESNGKRFTLFAGEVDNGDVLVNVFEVRDEYPINPNRGAEFKENGEPYSITRLINYFQTNLEKRREDALDIQRKMKNASEAEKVQLQEKLDDHSRYINLYEKRIEQLQTKPLKVGSRQEATTAGNWE